MTGASNSREAVRALVGMKVVGVLFDALPLNRADLQSGNKTLIFEDGTGFTFSNSGSFWWENARDVEQAVKLVERKLRETKADLRGVLELAGVVSQSTPPRRGTPDA